MTTAGTAGRPGRLPQRWLLLRGLAREAGHWHGFAEVFAGAVGLEPAAVTCLDLPGTGAVRGRRAPLGVAGTTEDLRRRWRRSDGGAATGVLGISLGAMVALDWTIRHDGDFVTAVLVNGSAGGLSPPWRRLRPDVLPLAARIAAARDPRRREELILRMTAARLAGERREEILRARVGLAAERPISVWTSARQLAAANRFRLPAGGPSATCLVLGSDGDRMVDPGCSRDLAGALGMSLKVHPWGGHDLPLDDPAWVAARVADWLGSGRHAP